MVTDKLSLIKVTRHIDDRGFFAEIYSQHKYEELGIATRFVQDNHSLSKQVGVLRGLHFQAPPYAQAKIGKMRSGPYLMLRSILGVVARIMENGKAMS